MKRILFLAPYCIPVNNPEAICNAKLLKVLSEAGYVIDVIGKNNLLAYAPDEEEQLFSGKLASVKTFTLSNKISWRTATDHFRVLLKTGYVYKGAHWALYAINYAETLIHKNKYDCIMSRSPASELAALYLCRKYHIKWIANWNDPYPEKRMPWPYGGGKAGHLNYFERHLLDAVSQNADLHTFPSERLRDYMLQYMKGVTPEKTVIIPHVCLEHLFVRKARKKREELVFVHSGNVSFPRDPRPFLEGVKLFLEKKPTAQIEICFLGKQSGEFTDYVEKLHLAHIVKVMAPLGYLENLSFIAGCDIAVLIEAPGENSVYLPTKVGDYMQCGKPIFTVSPSTGTLRDLYEKGAVEYFADCKKPEEIAGELVKIYSLREYYKENNVPHSIYSPYSAGNVLNTYLQILEK